MLSYLSGMQDTNLNLRESLKTYINHPESSHELKFRWLTSRKAYYQSVSIECDTDTFENVC